MFCTPLNIVIIEKHGSENKIESMHCIKNVQFMQGLIDFLFTRSPIARMLLHIDTQNP